MFYRDTWCEIDLDALKKNIEILKACCKKELFAVVKANAYGVGDYQVVKTAEKCGVTIFAVSTLDEAIALRKKGITADILVLGVSRLDNLVVAVNHDIILTVPSVKWAEGVVKRNIKGLRLHIKVDTGMHRLGVISKEEVERILDLLTETNSIEGIFSHFANSDEKDHVVSDCQYHMFKDIVSGVAYDFRWVHMSNSDATIDYKEDFTNAVRCGIALFGASVMEANLIPVVSLYTKITHVQQLPEKSAVSYSGKYTTQGNEWIATLPIGYADGFMRLNENGRVYINDEYATIVGRVCMDQLMIHMENEYPIGTVVELIGTHVPVQEVAQRCQTIPHEILSGLGDRVVRIYLEDQQVKEIVNKVLDDIII